MIASSGDNSDERLRVARPHGSVEDGQTTVGSGLTRILVMIVI